MTLVGGPGHPGHPEQGGSTTTVAPGGVTPPAPAPPTIDHISWSQFGTYTDCAKKYQLSKLAGLDRKPKGYFVGGRTVHETIEESESIGWWGYADAWLKEGAAWQFFQDKFTEEMKEEGGVDAIEWGGKKSKEFPAGESEPWWRAVGPMMLRRYAGLRREDATKGRILESVEARFTVNLPSGRTLVAYPDMVFTTLIRDWKTGSTYEPSDLGLQVGTYEWIRRELGMDPIRNGEYVFLRAKDGRLTYSVPLDPWVELIPTLLDQMQRRLDVSLETDVWPYSPGKHCGWCDVAEHCEVGQRWLSVKAGR